MDSRVGREVSAVSDKATRVAMKTATATRGPVTRGRWRMRSWRWIATTTTTYIMHSMRSRACHVVGSPARTGNAASKCAHARATLTHARTRAPPPPPLHTYARLHAPHVHTRLRAHPTAAYALPSCPPSRLKVVEGE